ncbi:MAG TPA: ABC transporter substrate-binding protein [Nocardioidaceae bacterium]|nr:ABC transporter substrate-binding protein [Nocardioidaceae bacterium]
MAGVQQFSGSSLNRRDFLRLGGMAGAAALLGGCGGSSTPPGAGSQGFGSGTTYNGPKVTLQFWNGFTGGDGPFLRQLVDQFSREQKNIDVKMTVLEWEDYYSKMPNAVASGSGPDIGIMHIDQLATNAARQVIIPLDEVAESLELTEGDFHPVVWNAAVYNDRRYGIPLDIHPLGFYYNAAEMQEAGVSQPPTDAASWGDAIDALQQSGVQNPFWVTATWPAHLMFTSLIHQFGGSMFNEDATEATFASPEGMEALQWYVSWIQQGASPRNVAEDAQAIAFKQGRNAMTWDGIWMMNEWNTVNSLDWGVAPVPTIGEQPAVWASSHNFVVMQQREADQNKLDAARIFISWISDHSIDWAKSGQIPARTSVRESAEFQQLETQSTLAQQLPDVVFPPAVPGIGDITIPTYEQAVNEVVLGRKSVNEALTQAQSEANQMLAENRDKYGA